MIHSVMRLFFVTTLKLRNEPDFFNLAVQPLDKYFIQAFSNQMAINYANLADSATKKITARLSHARLS
jgi:hypothetical protein